MELDMWNNYLQPSDWSVTLPVDRSDGLFGDIKSEGCLYGDDLLGLHLQDAVDHVRSESPSKNEDILGREWMESSDLGSFLEVLGSHDKLLPLEASLIEYTFSTAPDEPVTFDDLVAKHGSPKSLDSSEEYTTLEHFLSRPLICVTQTETYDALLSPPTSPEQVAPVIKLEHVGTAGGAASASLVDLFADSTFEATGTEHDIFGGMSFSDSGDTETSVVTFDDSSEFISSPLSADDVDSMLTGSSPGSPSTCHSSIIESSPELYKVILTSSVESAKRFSPYSRPKPSKQSKASKTLALELSVAGEEEIQEVIGEHLSKKDRKKLQNKNAAIRYRMKKKEEALGIKSEEQILEELNLELKTKVEDLQREIKYMKNLMDDVCRAKGLTLK